MKKQGKGDLVSNRAAFHHYEILETLEAGIVLRGTEIKSLRDGGGHLADSFIVIVDGLVWLKGASIAPYRFGNIHNHEEKADRQLLLHKKEITRLKKASSEKGFALIPIALYLKKGWVKVKVGIGKGKKQHDKRESIKEREDKRDIERAFKENR